MAESRLWRVVDGVPIDATYQARKIACVDGKGPNAGRVTTRNAWPIGCASHVGWQMPEQQQPKKSRLQELGIVRMGISCKYFPRLEELSK